MDHRTGARAAFAEAAHWFAETVPAARGHEDEPGLGVWTVRDLVGHTSRSLLTLESYLDAGARDAAGPADLDGPVASYRATADALADGAAIAQRGRDAGAALGDDLAAAVTALVARVLPRLAAPDDAPVATPFGRTTLAGYLPTRTVELTVHTCDIAVALGRPAHPPAAAAAATAAVLAGLAAASGTAGDLLLAATGRRPLPAGYSAL